jgi:hypothetical protein
VSYVACSACGAHGPYEFSFDKAPIADAIAAWNERADEVKADLLEALEGLMHKGESEPCWCDMAIGHPAYHDHSDECKAAHAAIAKARGER